LPIICYATGRNAGFDIVPKVPFATALIFPQWQGAGRRIGYIAGNACLEGLLPASLSRHHIICEETQTPLPLESGVKGLTVLTRQADQAAAIRQSLTEPVLTIGGDCAADLVSAAWVNRSDDAALIWIDGHADLNTPDISPSGHFHGMVVRSLMGDGPASLIRHVGRPYRADQVFYVSARDCDPAESDDIARMQLFRLPDAAKAAMLADEIASRGIRRIYLHLDLDVLDPAIFPYVGVPATNGLGIDELCLLLQLLRRRFSLAGAAITELNIGSDAEAIRAAPLLQLILRDGFGL